MQLSTASGTAIASSSQPALEPDYAVVRRAIRFLSENWEEQPDLDRLAGHLGLGPTQVQKLFKRTKSSIADVDVVEFNEAFAAQVLACLDQLDVMEDQVNRGGGAIALGHPVGASGGRLLANLLRALEQTNGRYGLQTMCEGGGMANATIIERLG